MTFLQGIEQLQHQHRRVARRRYGYQDPGTHTVSLRTAGWAAGTYPYRLVVDETVRTGTIRVVR